MGDKINKEFEKYQEELEIRKKNLKLPSHFELDENLDEILKEVKEKEITL